jgi:hypothetical protein
LNGAKNKLKSPKLKRFISFCAGHCSHSAHSPNAQQKTAAIH